MCLSLSIHSRCHLVEGPEAAREVGVVDVALDEADEQRLEGVADLLEQESREGERTEIYGERKRQRGR